MKEKELKKYPKYKPSGVEWIGEIPDEWDCKKIKRLSNVKRGASPRPIDDPKYFDNNGEFSWVRISDVTASERYLEETTQSLSDLGASLSVKRFPGDFFLSIAGTVGKPIITKIKCCIHDGFVWFPNLRMNPEYLYYIFSTGLPYQGLGKWGTQLNLNTDTVGEINIPIPTDEEINNLVNYLDDKTAKIDSLIEKKKKLIELLKEERTVIINQAVTRGIDPNVKLKDSGIEWLGEIPEHWEVKKLKGLTDIITNGFVGPTRDILVQNGVRYIQSLHIKENTIKFEYPYYVTEEWSIQHSRSILKEKDILVVQTGAGTGNIGIVPKEFEGCNCHALIIIRIDYKKSEPDFIMNLLTSYYGKNTLRSIETGALHPHLNSTKICDINIPVPPKTEQKIIVQHIETETKRIDDTISKIEKEIELLAEYRTALISEVVTGKIDVRNAV